MKTTIVYVFKIIAILIISGVLWFLTIGTLGSDNAYGYFDSDTPFKRSVWGAGETAFVELALTTSDTYGYGYEARTTNAWSGASKEQSESGQTVFTVGNAPMIRGGVAPNTRYNYFD